MSETLERIIPTELNENLTWQSHQDRYLWASSLVKNKKVIDAACGVGYGSRLLLDLGAKEVLGIDVDKGAVAHAEKSYKKDGLNFMVGDLTKISLPGQKFDVFISFETMEHLSDPETLLETVKKHLTEEGILIVSVPNMLSWKNFKNKYHLFDFEPKTFSDLLKKYFKKVALFDQHYLTSSTITPVDQKTGEVATKVIFPANLSEVQPANLVAICSDYDLPDSSTDKVFLSNEDMVSAWNYVETLKKEIESLRSANSNRMQRSGLLRGKKTT